MRTRRKANLETGSSTIQVLSLCFNLAMSKMSPKLRFFEDCFFRFEWCSGNFSKAPIDLGGHTMSEVGIQLKSNSILHNHFLTQIKPFRFKLVLVPNCTLIENLNQVNVIDYVNSKVGNADFVSGHHTTQVSSR